MPYSGHVGQAKSRMQYDLQEVSEGQSEPPIAWEAERQADISVLQVKEGDWTVHDVVSDANCSPRQIP